MKLSGKWKYQASYVNLLWCKVCPKNAQCTFFGDHEQSVQDYCMSPVNRAASTLWTSSILCHKTNVGWRHNSIFPLKRPKVDERSRSGSIHWEVFVAAPDSQTIWNCLWNLSFLSLPKLVKNNTSLINLKNIVASNTINVPIIFVWSGRGAQIGLL